MDVVGIMAAYLTVARACVRVYVRVCACVLHSLEGQIFVSGFYTSETTVKKIRGPDFQSPLLITFTSPHLCYLYDTGGRAKPKKVKRLPLLPRRKYMSPVSPMRFPVLHSSTVYSLPTLSSRVSLRPTQKSQESLTRSGRQAYEVTVTCT